MAEDVSQEDQLQSETPILCYARVSLAVAATELHLCTLASQSLKGDRRTSEFPACFARQVQDHIGAGRVMLSASSQKFITAT